MKETKGMGNRKRKRNIKGVYRNREKVKRRRIHRYRL